MWKRHSTDMPVMATPPGQTGAGLHIPQYFASGAPAQPGRPWLKIMEDQRLPPLPPRNAATPVGNSGAGAAAGAGGSFFASGVISTLPIKVAPSSMTRRLVVRLPT